MGVRGTKPKPAGQVRRRNRPTHEWTDVVDAPFTGAPKLPARRPDGRGWPAWTKAWYADVSRMPHCVLWRQADWRFCFETALVVAEVHEGNVRLSTEVRNREKVLGTTVDFRRDLRIRYINADDEDGTASPLARLDDYRDLCDYRDL